MLNVVFYSNGVVFLSAGANCQRFVCKVTKCVWLLCVKRLLNKGFLAVAPTNIESKIATPFHLTFDDDDDDDEEEY